MNYWFLVGVFGLFWTRKWLSPFDLTKNIFKEQSSAHLVCCSRAIAAFLYVSRVFPYFPVHHFAVSDREFHLHVLLMSCNFFAELHSLLSFGSDIWYPTEPYEFLFYSKFFFLWELTFYFSFVSCSCIQTWKNGIAVQEACVYVLGSIPVFYIQLAITF